MRRRRAARRLSGTRGTSVGSVGIASALRADRAGSPPTAPSPFAPRVLARASFARRQRTWPQCASAHRCVRGRRAYTRPRRGIYRLPKLASGHIESVASGVRACTGAYACGDLRLDCGRAHLARGARARLCCGGFGWRGKQCQQWWASNEGGCSRGYARRICFWERSEAGAPPGREARREARSVKSLESAPRAWETHDDHHTVKKWSECNG